MFMNFLRENRYAVGILTLIRVYIGWSWLTAGWGKVTGEFNAAGFLMGAINNETVIEYYPTFHAFLENFAIPNAEMFSVMVAWGELLVGLGLIFGVLTTTAAFFGIMMNFAFMFAGTLSTNPWMVLFTIFILAAGYNAGRFGGDHWVIPFIRQQFLNKRNKKRKVVNDTVTAS
ncbi:Crp/Fnr family transcriptional regulator [Salipaludibacillus neizhouensis]|uniref:Crp/Fnr family transcriptional regulator n=1 Tax=Salipaludibacillus neizhouensis TaxID=885475 RepID=A0A3A9KBG8_9BACI|nr:DoxX family protein [Salipaludibacillus neizhouensis]RKL67882.1 Crp/Fnr family transcriptional regulator [Salipaludibacillus neizhouensis]